jgi:hypothetical protein
MKMHRITIQLTPRQYAVLRREVERLQLSNAEVLRRVLDRWLEALTNGSG